MEFFLLTHSREVAKSSNTGQIVLHSLPGKTRRIIWNRTEPDNYLLDEIKQGGLCLVYPVAGQNNEAKIDSFRGCIILDGTWQETRKIYNRSPYLTALPKISIQSAKDSDFRLRRNQKSNGLSTVETVAHILEQTGATQISSAMLQQFEQFQTEWLGGGQNQNSVD